MFADQIVRALPRLLRLRPFTRAKMHHVLGPNRWILAPVRVRPASAVGPAVDNVVDGARVSDCGKNRVRAIVLRLAESTTPIPALATEFAVSRARVHSIAQAAVRKGFLDQVPGRWPNIYRPGPNLLRQVLNPSVSASAATLKSGLMPHEPFPGQSGAPRTFTLRAHGLQAAIPVLGLEHADLGAWTPWRTKTGPMWKVSANGLRMQLRGRTLLVVSVPSISLETSEDTLDGAETRIRNRVSEYVSIARKVAHERYGIVAGSPATWYRQPEFAIEHFPGVPEGVRYRASFWVDSSMGSSEVESTSLRTTRALLAIGNQISLDLSTSTF